MSEGGCRGRRLGAAALLLLSLFFFLGRAGGGLLEGSVEEGDGCDGVGVGYCVVMLVRGQ